MTLDTELFYALNSLAGHSRLLDSVIVFSAQYLPYLVVVAFIAMLARSALASREKWLLGITAFAAAFVARFGVVELIRAVYARPRPFVDLPGVHALLTDSSWSFPSGHASFFFALATVICLANRRWGSWLFAAATLISVARVAAGVHYPSDILGGVIVGAVTGYATYQLVLKLTKKSA